MRFSLRKPLQLITSHHWAAIVSLALLCIFLISPSFAKITPFDQITNQDQNHYRLLQEHSALDAWDTLSNSASNAIYTPQDGRDDRDFVRYDAEFAGLDRSFIARAVEGQIALASNYPNTLDISAGETHYYVFPNSSIWGDYALETEFLPASLKNYSDGSQWLSQDGTTANNRTVYISITTCLQPYPNTATSDSPPQLTVYLSTDDNNQTPGPGTDYLNRDAFALDDGFASFKLNVTGSVYISVSAQDLAGTPFAGPWNYEIAASIDAPYHRYNGLVPFMYFVDSDQHNTLLVTDNITETNASDPTFQKWQQVGMPFTMFAQNTNNTAISGVGKSFCGLQNNAQIVGSNATGNVDMSMVTRGLGGKPKEQFFVSGLNASSSYYGILGMRGNSTDAGPGVVGGGGQLWQKNLTFVTKTEDNCRVIYNLTFCSDVAYAVPANPANSSSALVAFYDNQTSSLYQNFNYSLQQIPCNTTITAQYSLVRNCTDCARDYKNWLCAVSIPRCEDFSSTLPHLQPRNVAQNFTNGSIPDPSNPATDATLQNRLYANSSRNPQIDAQIAPGPYKELLPCADLCYSLVQSCPAALGFACPLPGKGLEVSYGRRGGEGVLSCNYVGAAYFPNGAATLGGVGRGWAVVGVAFLSAWLAFV